MMSIKDVQKLVEENKRLMGEAVFLTKQVSNRDKTIQALDDIVVLGIDGVTYATKV